MSRIVIACHRPKPGKEEQLRKLVSTHVARLKKEGLVTDRAPILMQAEDGTFLEVFEWASRDAIKKAHENPRVLEMWAEYDAVGEAVPVGRLPEADQLFSEFSPVAD